MMLECPFCPDFVPTKKSEKSPVVEVRFLVRFDRRASANVHRCKRLKKDL